jgi:hypothetical protein
VTVEDGRLVDLYAIQQLKARYFRYIDTKQWDLFRGLFTDDAAFFFFDDSDFHADSTGAPPRATREFSGGDKFVGRVSKILETAVTVHHGHMPEIEFTGPGEATGIWAMYDWVDDFEKGYATKGAGHYHEKYLKGDDGCWRISELRLTRLRTDLLDPTRPTGPRNSPGVWNP